MTLAPPESPLPIMRHGKNPLCARLGSPAQVPSGDATPLRYDTNVRQDTPLVRVTSFPGKPRRRELTFDMGTWLEVLRMELLRLEVLRRSGTEAVFYSGPPAWGSPREPAARGNGAPGYSITRSEASTWSSRLK